MPCKSAAPDAELAVGPFAAASFAGHRFHRHLPGLPVQEANVLAARLPWRAGGVEIELFAWAVHARSRSKIVAITGSNGKTTTTTALTAHLANAAGVPAVACGNISPSALMR